MTISRRQVVVGGVVTALAVAADVATPLARHLVPSFGLGPSDVVLPDESDPNLTQPAELDPKQAVQTTVVRPRLLDSQDPNFDATLDSLFPGLRQNKRFARLRPFSAILVNTASNPIYGYSLRWRITSKSGVKESYNRHFFKNVSPHLDVTQVTGQEPILLPGGSALITPLFFWSATTDDGSPSTIKLSRWRLRQYKNAAFRGHGFVVRHAKASNLKVSMDARVYATKARGNNPKLAAKVYRGRRNGEHDQAFSFLTRCVGANGALDQKLLEKQIASATEYFRDAAQNGQQRSYSLARARFAQKVKFCLGTHGMDRVQQVLEGVNGISRTKLSVG